MIQFELRHEKAKLPQRQTDGAAGFDLHSVESADIPSGCQATLDTGIAMAIPHGWFGRIMPRSGWAVRHGINVHAGLIDSDYRGVVKVCLINHGGQTVEIRAGDRIAQIVFAPCMLYSEQVDALGSTGRGQGGFGSTGGM